LTATGQPTEATRSHDGGARPPQLADGIELVGRYEDSGYKDPPFIARRDDGGMIQLPALLYALAEELDGKRGYDDVAERLSEKLGKGVTAENVRFLVEQKLWPLGVVRGPNGEQPQMVKADPLLALKFRTAIVPKGAVRALTTVFKPLFWPPVLLAMLLAIAAVDVWFFFVHGVAQSAREIAYQPVLLVLVLALVIVATAFHEIGHATAARYGGAEPGVMGAGIYIVWPAFYTDVTDAYRLGRGGRLRTDLGGVYFNGLFVVLIAGAYAITRYEPLLILIVVQHFQVLQQFLPFLRLDGYYILSDLVGVPDMFARIKPTLKSAIPGRETEEGAAALKPWVRVVTTAWVIALIPVLLFTFGLLIFNLPRMFATAWDSLFVQLAKVDDGGFRSVAGVIQSVALVLPLGGATYTITRGSGRLVGGAWSWSEGAPVRRALVVATSVAIAAVAGWVLLPNGEYRPIQPGERGTLQGGLAQFRALPTGRPGLTREREEQLRGAPAVRDAPGQNDEEEQPTLTRQQTQATTESTETTESETIVTETAPATTGDTVPTETSVTTTTPTVTTETTP
jgi:putative peptide zinc metalloprotease protein